MAAVLSSVQVPSIAISLAPPQEPVAEPFSPFSPNGSTPFQEPDSPRPTLLSPPPMMSPRSPRQLSPLRPLESPVLGQGLERDRFEMMLKASRERNAAVGGKKSPDLRKEIAMKVHKSKQVERRALFLSKISAPPSPSATLTPKTPPESPAIFHYSLPSPGLESPLAVFEELSLEEDLWTRPGWVEQVDFRIPGQSYYKTPRTSVPTKKHLPSLDEITARLSFRNAAAASAVPQGRFSPRLPTFLKSTAPASATREVAKRVLPAVGRLQFPNRPPSPPSPIVMGMNSPPPQLPPPSPSSPMMPKLQITTMVVPCSSSHSPTEFTESNIRALSGEPREKTARDMVTRLRRRTLPPNSDVLAAAAKQCDEERKLRRHSAPPELPLRERVGFMGPVLDIPGAF
ncbi:hypothetical protein C8Q75DRAFT_721923 [Abortiporus biennis]|nr:hypothetical protein C8Q75DRAFT_721923 [Abortiporus biennis]